MSSPAEAGEGEPLSAAKRLAGPTAKRWGGEGPLLAVGPHLSHFTLVKRAPFFSRFAGEDEVRQIPDNAFEQKRCVNQIANAVGGEMSAQQTEGGCWPETLRWRER